MIKAPVKAEKTIDHNVHPHRMRWIICDKDNNVIMITDSKDEAHYIAHCINQREKQKELWQQTGKIIAYLKTEDDTMSVAEDLENIKNQAEALLAEEK